MFSEKNKNIYLLIFLAYWILLWLSINTFPSKQGLFTISGSMFATTRLIMALFSTLLMITFCFIYIIIKKNLKLAEYT